MGRYFHEFHKAGKYDEGCPRGNQMGFINNLKDKQKDQSAKNWFDLGVQTKSLDKKVKYFTKCLLIEPENVQALRLLADAQDELGMIDAAMGSRARADDIESSSGAFSQGTETYTESNSFGSDSFSSDTMFAEENNESFVEENTFTTPAFNDIGNFDTPISETETGIETSDSNNDKWAIFEIAKENEAKRNEEPFSTGSEIFNQPETNLVVEELNVMEEQTTATSTEPEAPVRTRPEPVVAVNRTEVRAAAPVREQVAAKPAAERPVGRPAPTTAPSPQQATSYSTAVPQAMSQSSIPEPVAMKLPMGEIIKFWVVGAAVLIIVGMIMNYLTV